MKQRNKRKKDNLRFLKIQRVIKLKSKSLQWQSLILKSKRTLFTSFLETFNLICLELLKLQQRYHVFGFIMNYYCILEGQEKRMNEYFDQNFEMREKFDIQKLFIDCDYDIQAIKLVIRNGQFQQNSLSLLKSIRFIQQADYQSLEVIASK
ncbi:unnamed protein product [Paramecium octaurelia]|uniref:Uncharacterized protein n=1 Tax=Paramecium octaurelia TaxID=43137 RepID=A0A8S1V0G4_PAROT|nr:unnamed protein product [Paramecium octaurelia]